MKAVDIPVYLIKAYQFISRRTPAVCRFEPTCSSYAVEALMKYGLWKGGFLAMRRILCCHPWHRGGPDPLE
jgi:putative membrane protein insertion efficiency factor